MQYKFFDGNRDPAFKDAALVRREVFVEEQGFSYDLDGTDAKATHLVLYDEGKPIAAGRAFLCNETDNVYAIGRISVRKEYRKRMLGRQVMLALETHLKSRGAVKTRLSAQKHAEGFYRKLGYAICGEPYWEEFCPHIPMEKLL